MTDIKLTDRQKANNLYQAFTRQGNVIKESGEIESLRLKDLVTTEDIRPFVPRVIRRIIVESLEPNMIVVPNLFTVLNLPEGQMVEIGAIGSIVAGKVAQGDIYPVTTLATDTEGAGISITVSKYGCAINIAKEVITDNQFDVITLWLRAAGAALARLKEKMGIELIDAMGITVFDNADATGAEIGNTSGRDIDGAVNGSMTLNDIFDMWAYLALRGFTPDTLIMSPLAWKVFAVDPQLREIVLNGAVLATRRMPLGAGASGFADPFNGLGLNMQATGNNDGSSAYLQTLTPVNATWNMPPKYLPSPLKVLVSHLVPFTENGHDSLPLTDIIMADSQRCGILVQKEQPTTEEGDIFANDVHQVHIYERYGMNLFDQGKAIVVARNIVVTENAVFDNVNSRSLSALNRKTNLV